MSEVSGHLAQSERNIYNASQLNALLALPWGTRRPRATIASSQSQNNIIMFYTFQQCAFCVVIS